MLTQLSVKAGTSRGRNTYGWPMVTLIVNSSGKCYRARGGGYDMYGTVIAEYLESAYQDRLRVIAASAFSNGAPGGMSAGNIHYILFRGVSRPQARGCGTVLMMGVGPPRSVCRDGPQTTVCCCVQKTWW